MSKVAKETKETQNPAHSEFTGIARTVVCYDNQGFKNFRIITLHLDRGRVVKQEQSDPYASFECISRMEVQNELAIHSLNNNWTDGKALFK